MEEKILSAIKMLTELHMSDEKALELIKDDNTDINEVFYLEVKDNAIIQRLKLV